MAFWETWGRFQPAIVDDLGEVLVADPAGHVAVCWRHRARDGERWLDAPVVSVYEVRDGLVAESTMFDLDTTALLEFLERRRRCRDPSWRPPPRPPASSRNRAAPLDLLTGQLGLGTGSF